jgi:hypothetical protein
MIWVLVFLVLILIAILGHSIWALPVCHTGGAILTVFTNVSYTCTGPS